MQVGDGFLYGSHAGAETDAFQAGGDAHIALRVLAANFILAGVAVERGEAAESSGASGCADDGSVHHLIERGAGRVREADADGIDAVVQDDGGGGGFAFEDGGSVDGDLFGSEAGASGGGCVDLKCGSGAADRVFDTVEYIDDATGFTDSVGDAGCRAEERFRVL